MPSFKIINNKNDISLSPEWVDATKFDCKDKMIQKNGRTYRLIIKKERDFLWHERLGRILLGTLLTLSSLGLSLLLSKHTWKLLANTKEKIRYGILVKNNLSISSDEESSKNSSSKELFHLSSAPSEYIWFQNELTSPHSSTTTHSRSFSPDYSYYEENFSSQSQSSASIHSDNAVSEESSHVITPESIENIFHENSSSEELSRSASISDATSEEPSKVITAESFENIFYENSSIKELSHSATTSTEIINHNSNAETTYSSSFNHNYSSGEEFFPSHSESSESINSYYATSSESSELISIESYEDEFNSESYTPSESYESDY